MHLALRVTRTAARPFAPALGASGGGWSGDGCGQMRATPARGLSVGPALPPHTKVKVPSLGSKGEILRWLKVRLHESSTAIPPNRYPRRRVTYHHMNQVPGLETLAMRPPTHPPTHPPTTNGFQHARTQA